MAANGLKDDGIDVGDILVIPKASGKTEKAAAAPIASARKPVAARPPNKELRAPSSGKKPARAVSVASSATGRQETRETQPAPVPTPRPSFQLPATNEVSSVGPEVAKDDDSEALLSASANQETTQKLDEAQGVGISTLAMPTVKPLSRAWAGLGVAALVLLAMIAHPRTRRLLVDRASSVGGRRAVDIDARIDVLSSFSVGNGQRILSLSVDDHRLLVGVSQGRMDVLHRWSREEGTSDDSGFDATVASPAVSGPAQADTSVPSDDAGSLGFAAPAPPPASTSVAPDAGRVRVATVSLDSSQDARDPRNAPSGSRAPRRAAVAQTAANEASMPSSDHLMSLWKNSVDTQGNSTALDDENESGWWMEGATGVELDRLADEDIRPEDPVDTLLNEAQANRRRDQAAHEVLATLRTRRLVEGDADDSTTGRSRGEGSTGRRVARLGRRSRLNSGAAAAASETSNSDVTTRVVRRML